MKYIAKLLQLRTNCSVCRLQVELVGFSKDRCLVKSDFGHKIQEFKPKRVALID